MSPTFAIVIPYYNERDFLERTLRSWLAQSRLPDQLILVDNGSTDGSADLCRRIVADRDDVDIVLLHEPRAGKVHALETGCAQARADFIALADADTYYPPHYLQTCARLARAEPQAVGLMALSAGGDPASAGSRWRRRWRVQLSKVFRRQGYVGGYGHVLQADALRRAGGFSARYWDYVLLDHEVLHRLFRYGHAIYHMDLWCQPSDRRGNRRRVRWNLLERSLYHATPFRLHGWYFHRFLGPRLARRNLSQLNLREQPWQTTASAR